MSPSNRIIQYVGAFFCAGVLAVPLQGEGKKPETSVTAWNQWRGPHRNGSTEERGWSHDWAEDGPKELWRVTLEPGYSAVSIGDRRLYTNGGTFKDEVVYCLEPGSGKTAWKFTFPQTEISTKRWTRGAFATPAVDGNRVFVQSMSGYVAALDAVSGKMVWGQDLIEATGAPAPNYGFSSSPLVSADVVVCAGAVGLDKKTGKILWRAKGVPAYYPSPVPFTAGSRNGVVFVSDKTFACVNPADGQVLWELARGNGNFFPDPVAIGERILFWNALYRVENGKPVRVYCTSYSPDATSLYGSPVVWEGHVYRLSDVGLECRDLDTGELRWTEKRLMGTLTLAGGKLLILSKQGELIVAEAGRDGYKERARCRAFKNTGLIRDVGVWSAPVLSKGKLYLRGYHELVCYDLSGG